MSILDKGNYEGVIASHGCHYWLLFMITGGSVLCVYKYHINLVPLSQIIVQATAHQVPTSPDHEKHTRRVGSDPTQHALATSHTKFLHLYRFLLSDSLVAVYRSQAGARSSMVPRANSYRQRSNSLLLLISPSSWRAT